MSFYFRSLVLLAIVVACVRAQRPVCYTQNGVEDKNQFPCDPTSELSTCCGLEDVCFSNGLCSPPADKPTATEFFWNGCTDPTFEDDVCFKECLAGKLSKIRDSSEGNQLTNVQFLEMGSKVVEERLIAVLDLGVAIVPTRHKSSHYLEASSWYRSARR